ncbi:hypothetical protein [Helicobacter sp. 23-1046]
MKILNFISVICVAFAHIALADELEQSSKSAITPPPPRYTR